MSRKLGGPVIVSPPKSSRRTKSSSKRTSATQSQKPGAALRRVSLNKEPQTLERALSVEQEHRRSMSRTPSVILDLMRATTAAQPMVKREDSDTVSLKSMASNEATSKQTGRVSLSRSSSFAGLEDPKTSKKAKIEAELRDAISNLRKPNREVVGKDMAEAAERKTSTAVSAKSKPCQFRLVGLILLTQYGRTAQSGQAFDEWRRTGQGNSGKSALQGCLCCRA